jgi:Reverse transcriptase (RNA-dependent DNA polymerase)
MKESHPCETAEFARAQGIAGEAAIAWWVPYTLQKREVILSKIKARLRKTTNKYGIEIPNSMRHAFEIDKLNGNTIWRDTIAKEMTEMGIGFEILEENEQGPKGWSKVTGHLVWDVKMDFTRKARWVLDGHLTPNPIGSTYAGVVSRDSVRIAFTYAALNDVDIFAVDIRNAYLQAPSSQKDYIVCGPEFGLENEGKVALIHRALYGGKLAGRDFRNHLRSCMRYLNFTSCPADPDVWLRPAIKSDGSEYYEYILLYTDDTLVISELAERVLRGELGQHFTLKEESIVPPKIYLGGSVRKVTLNNGVKCWSFSSLQYMQAAVKNVEDYLKRLNNPSWKMPAKAETPMQTSYQPELDVSPELDTDGAVDFMSLIGVLRWIVELGRIDVCLECSLLSSHLALPREGHLKQLLQVFAYLRKYHNTEMVFDPSDPTIDEASFELRDWTSSEFGHLQSKEELPPNMPQPRGMGFVMRAKVDADHTADTTTRGSRTGFIVYLNCAPAYWSSKKQASVESSSFGSEFIAMKQCCECLRGLRYKLRMLGIPFDRPA